MDRDFKGIWIPKEVWVNPWLNPKEKIYMGIYLSTNSVSETDKIMLEQCSHATIAKIKDSLERYGMLTFPETPEEAKAKTIELKGKGGECEWCGERNYILQEHHYPIPRFKGGTEVVRICPNCHATYHHIFKEQ